MSLSTSKRLFHVHYYSIKLNSSSMILNSLSIQLSQSYFQICKIRMEDSYPANVTKNFKVLKMLASGSFGSIFEGVHTKTGLEVAIKFDSTPQFKDSLVYRECQIYKSILSDSSVLFKGVPNVYYCQKQGIYNFLVMDLLGPSLDQLFYECSKQFSLKTVLMLIDQMLTRIEILHKNKCVHLDLKPDNFCIGPKKLAQKIYMVDFGLSQRYKRKGNHVAFSQNRGFTGTPRYASINAHQGYRLSCRDDMESIGYIALYFLRGSLPWQGKKFQNLREKCEYVKEKKISIPLEVLCKGFPDEFVKYITYSRNLAFEEQPDYAGMRKIFKDLFKSLGYTYDYQYDWIILREKQAKIEKKEDPDNDGAVKENVAVTAESEKEEKKSQKCETKQQQNDD